MNPFQQIPATVRKWLYIAYGVVGIVLGGLQVAQVDHVGDVSVLKALAVLAYVGTALGFTAASNVTDTQTVVTSAPAAAQVTTTVEATFPGNTEGA